MKILIITSESQVYRDLTYKKRKIKKLLPSEANPIHDKQMSAHIAPEKYEGFAKNIFLGRVIEVIGLFNELKAYNYDTELVILSSLYGIIHPEDIIKPYWTINGHLNLKSIPNELPNLIKEADIVILVLDTIKLKWIYGQIKPYLDEKMIAIISAGSLKQDTAFKDVNLYLSTKGVARIGVNNKKTLIDWLKNK